MEPNKTGCFSHPKILLGFVLLIVAATAIFLTTRPEENPYSFFSESNGSGQTDGYIGDWGDEIASAKVTLNSVGLLDFSSAVQAQTVIHEFGHALGLKHPEPAVMQDNTNLAAYVILDHDVESLQAIYE